MTTCKLVVLDEVNVKYEGLDVSTRRKMVDELKYFLPYARHLPAVKLGRWDGSVSFSDIGGRSYLNLIDRLVPIIQAAGYDIEIEDHRVGHSFEFDKVTEDSYSHILWPAKHQLAGQPIIIKDHQVQIINSYLSNLQSVSIVPTGGGKTIITGVLSHKVEKYGRSIVIVPSKDLVTQTEEDYKNMNLDVGVFYGDRKDYNKTHTICTWQSLESLYKTDRELLDQFLEGVICVICDETHRAKGDVLKKLLTGPFKNIPIRWGLTGTLPEEESDQITVKICIGDLVDEIQTSDLQEKGVLAGLHIYANQYQDLGESFGNYQAELKWLMSNDARLRAIANSITEVSQSGNTLVLVDRIEAGEKLEKYIPNSVFVSGKLKSADRKKEYEEIREVDNKVIIATYGVASTGTNIPRIFNLFLIEPGKSFVRVIQSIGRGLRVTPDKDFVNVYDISSNSKYSKKHLAKRKKFYQERGYEYTTTKISY